MAVAMALAVMIRRRDHAKFRSSDAPPPGLLDLKLRSGIEALERVDQRAGRSARIQQRAHRHIPADAGKSIEISDSHSLIIGGAFPSLSELIRGGTRQEDEKDIEYLRLYFSRIFP